MFLLEDTTHRMIIRHDPDIGQLFVPNLRARLPGGDGGYLIRTNSSGFRSDIEFSQKKGERPRILMFGDSYTAGDNVANEQRFSDRLAELLDAEVYNYGIPGTGTDQHLLAFRKFARQVEADLIVVCVYIDSFHRIQVSHRPAITRYTGQKMLVPKPYFELAGEELRLHQVPVPVERLATEDNSPTDDKQDAWVQALLKWYNRIPGLRELRHSPTLEEFGSRLISALYRLRDEQPYEAITSTDTTGWKLMAAILRQFSADASPTPMIIAPIPTQSFYGHGVRPVYQPLFESLEDRTDGVHVVDVSTPLVRLPWASRQQLSFPVGGHFTPPAHDLVAKTMAGFIRERSLLPPAPDTVRVHASPPTSNGRSRRRPRQILGISCFYHNSAAALIRDSEIVAAAEEERFTRVKNDRRFPRLAVNYCLEEAGIKQHDLDAIVFYDNASLTFERICHSLMAVEQDPANRMWTKIMPSWLRMKLHFPNIVREQLRYDGLVLQGMHHRSHAASCFFPSPYERAAILTVDGVGEWSTASIGCGSGNELRLLKEMHFPHSLGLLYSAFTQFTGFKVNSGEYKMMGLAPYGEPRFAQTILDNLIDLKDDGSLEFNLEYFGFLHDEQMTNRKFAELFGGPQRQPESRITRREIDIARSIQEVVEESILRMARHAHELTGEQYLCMAGGVALNCVANGRLLREGPFDDIWIQPASGDSGCALGAALDAHFNYFGDSKEESDRNACRQGGSTFGPSYSEDEIRSFLETFDYPYQHLDEDGRGELLASQLNDGKVVGHFGGRLEYGPRSLGSRSIVGDPRNTQLQTELNLRIKYRESFRPFAPAVLRERVNEYFELDSDSPYMLLVAPVQASRRISMDEDRVPADEDLLKVVRQPRSDIPAVTHVDYSARVQTVTSDHHPEFWRLLKEFEKLTGCGVLVNTSFNVRGEPIVCTPQDAYRCFMRTEMDVLAIGNFVLLKEDQPEWPEERAEGLESEDAVAAVNEEHPAALLERLDRLFVKEFWPIAADLRQAGKVLVRFDKCSDQSAWLDAGEPPELKPTFEFATAFNSDDPHAGDIAAAICDRWQSYEVAEALRPVLNRMIEVGLKYPIEADIDETVSESVYAMF